MATKCSTTTTTDCIWNWVIEALASLEQVDTSTLIGLVKLAPAISGDAGKDAKEAVSLRILESLFVHGNEAINDTSSAQNVKNKISFDASKSCEDVLQQILHETPDLVTNSEKEKWDVQPFLMHKRSSLPKYFLKKLKESIVESSHPLLASLKERGNLVIANVSKDDSVVNPKKDKNKYQENVLQEADQVGNSTGRQECEMFTEHPLEGSNVNKSMEHDAHATSDTLPEGSNGSKSMEHDAHVTSETHIEESSERANIAAKKEAFLSSQCTLNQDSLDMTECSEMNLCMKCNKGSELLVCSSDACPLQVHKTCLGFAVTLDENQEFFCPFCAYSRAISEFTESKKKALLSRKNLQIFSSFTVKHSPKKTNETVVRPDNINCMLNEEDTVLPDASIPDINVNVNDEHVDDDVNDNVNIQTTELTQKPIPQPSTPKQDCKETESQDSFVSSSSRRLRKRKPQYIPPPVAFPSFRRKKIPWTKAEEEILKEGVEKYSSAMNKGIPWKEILYFGQNVFHKGRTAIDLKDKWRNICKGSPNVQ